MRSASAIQQATTWQESNEPAPISHVTQNGRNPLKPDNGKTEIRRDATQSFSQQPIQTHHQKDLIQQGSGLFKPSGEQKQPTLPNGDQHKTSLKSVSPAPLAQSVLPVSNAGCLILWPLFPTFFRTFGLLDNNRFISLEAQREAVCLLDWLIWAEDEIPGWRLTLNKVLCGLAINDNALWPTPKPEQQILIHQWLEKTIVQFPAWKKMGVNDVRHLFLQRSGELSGSEEVMEIHIKSEIYDALIAEWPWPINMASFSWLKQPITMTWL
ncbi:hypothetical protein XBKB1_1120004 [Xenorhabdus bovienii str. kraussei Becker Underwood]|uniref:Uncharacterized protein n=2 Tax=Xenorhabdus bovienii TaxID=40576 RepID=A0A077PR42_XENBV|nr:hypothetical protein XBKB1_1120004 [Xenorhabdus bovienii str. kraussei Becker Underwood]